MCPASPAEPGAGVAQTSSQEEAAASAAPRVLQPGGACVCRPSSPVAALLRPTSQWLRYLQAVGLTFSAGVFTEWCRSLR